MTKLTEDDFSAFFVQEMGVLELNDKHGEPMMFDGKRVKVNLFGPSTERNRKAREALQREATKNVIAAVGKGKKKEEGDKDADTKFLIAVTDSFENFPFPGGVEAIYRDPRLCFIAPQVQEYLGDLGNF